MRTTDISESTRGLNDLPGSRTNAGYQAHWLPADRKGALGCFVQNISDGGARIRFDHAPSDSPQSGRLYIQEIQLLAECERVWHNSDEIGVRFKSMVYLGQTAG